MKPGVSTPTNGWPLSPMLANIGTVSASWSKVALLSPIQVMA